MLLLGGDAEAREVVDTLAERVGDRVVWIAAGAARGRDPLRDALASPDVRDDDPLAALAARAAERPVVLCVTGVHLAAAEAWRRLGVLASSIGPAPVLLVATGRPGAGALARGAPGARAVDELERRGAARVVPLGTGPAAPEGGGEEAEWRDEHLVGADPAGALAELQRLRAGAGPDATPVIDLRIAVLRGWGLGEMAAAREDAARAVEALHWRGDARGAASAAVEGAWLAGLSGDLDAQVRAAREIMGTARAGGWETVLRRAAAAAAWAAAWRGRIDEAEDAVADADAPGVRALVAALAGDLGSEALRTADPQGDPDAACGAALAALIAGPPDPGAAAARATGEAPLGLADPRRALLAALGALCAHEAGEPGAGGPLDALGPAARAGPFAPVLAWAKAVAGPDGRSDGLRDAVEGLLGSGLPLPAGLAALDLAEAAEGAGPSAAVAVRASADLSGDRPLHRGLAAAVRAAGHGSADEALAAASALRAAGAHLLAARATLAAGRMRERAGDGAGALELLLRAAEAFEGAGATARRARVLEELARLGERGRRAAAGLGGAAALSSRELEVARLAARGLTAREIGERLGISRRTVETHLAHAYAKLGIASRRDLAARAAELGLS